MLNDNKHFLFLLQREGTLIFEPQPQIGCIYNGIIFLQWTSSLRSSAFMSELSQNRNSLTLVTHYELELEANSCSCGGPNYRRNPTEKFLVLLFFTEQRIRYDFVIRRKFDFSLSLRSTYFLYSLFLFSIHTLSRETR